MQNLNQIRARHVIAFANDPTIDIKGQNGGEVIKKIPPVIMNNGILSALAYAQDEKNKGWKAVFDGIAVHLASQEICCVPDVVYNSSMLLEHLTETTTTSAELREVTAEAMAWLDFARRLVK